MAEEAENTSIRVVVRCRPWNAREKEESTEEGIQCYANTVTQLFARDGDTTQKNYGFDHVFGPESPQDAVFQAVGEPLLDNAMSSYNGCLFAYGQTGTGKTFSMVGDLNKQELKGIIPRFIESLFERLKQKADDGGFEASVLASYLEIYNEKIFDLLSSANHVGEELQMRVLPQLGAVVVSLTESPMTNFDQAVEIFNYGSKRRAVASTQMNAASSRSHAVFTVQIRTKLVQQGRTTEGQAKMHFVDLAGSERQKKTGNSGVRLKEGIGINLSLVTLGRVISELSKHGKGLPPFRESKLTLMLKDALVGNSRTSLLAAISPAKFNLDETISTLEFASHCKLISTQAKKNVQSRNDIIIKLTAEKDAIESQLMREKEKSLELCRQLQEEIQKAEESRLAAENALKESLDVQSKLQESEKLLEEMKQQSPSKGPSLAPSVAEKEAEKKRMLERKKTIEQIEEDKKRLSHRLNELDSVVQKSKAVEDAKKQEERQREEELRAKLQEEMRAQQAREQEHAAQVAALKAAQESWQLNQEEMKKRTEMQQREREKALQKMGMQTSGIETEDLASAPRLVNLHPDPALGGCLVFYLATGDTLVGSDDECCRVRLAGLGIRPETCRLWNKDNVTLSVSPMVQNSVRKNGTVVKSDGVELEDGDRLAIGRAYVFQVQIPKAKKVNNTNEEVKFEQAMEEIDKRAELDPRWEKCVQKVVLMIKHELGTSAANDFLTKACRASEIIAEANDLLFELPKNRRDEIARFELSVLFDADCLPQLCVVARKLEGIDAFLDQDSFRPRAGIWELPHFEEEILPALNELRAGAFMHANIIAEETHAGVNWYIIQVTDPMVRTVRKRFNDFKAFDDSLRRRVNLLKEKLPTLPESGTFGLRAKMGVLASNFRQRRRDGLQAYLDQLANSTGESFFHLKEFLSTNGGDDDHKASFAGSMLAMSFASRLQNRVRGSVLG